MCGIFIFLKRCGNICGILNACWLWYNWCNFSNKCERKGCSWFSLINYFNRSYVKERHITLITFSEICKFKLLMVSSMHDFFMGILIRIGNKMWYCTERVLKFLGNNILHLKFYISAFISFKFKQLTWYQKHIYILPQYKCWTCTRYNNNN